MVNYFISLLVTDVTSHFLVPFIYFKRGGNEILLVKIIFAYQNTTKNYFMSNGSNQRASMFSLTPLKPRSTRMTSMVLSGRKSSEQKYFKECVPISKYLGSFKCLKL